MIYIIVEKENNLLVDYTDNFTDNGDGSFTNVTSDIMYFSGEYKYYEIDKVPAGVHANQYYYTPEEGFKLAFSNLDMVKARRITMENELQSKMNLTKVLNTYNAFEAEKSSIDENLKKLTDESLTTDERVLLLESTVCDLYELILSMMQEV